MRIAHATDIHWFVPPPFARLPGKRVFGTASLYVRGRRHHFDPAVQAALVQELIDQDPDLVIITGDLTAQALPEEFQLAHMALAPLFARVPVFVQPGNHDVYTTGSTRQRRMHQTFAEWMHLREGDPVARMDLGPVTILGLDPCRPHWSASGLVPEAQLTRLREILDGEDLDGQSIIVAQHYPVVDYKNALYDNPYHGLRNASDLVRLLGQTRNRPSALIHGHKHHGYTARMDVPNGGIRTFNPGSSGYAFQPHHERGAHFNLYTIDGDQGGVADLTRFRHDGSAFRALDGDAYP